MLDIGLEQVVAIEPEADHGPASPVVGEPAEGVGVLVDDGHRVALAAQAAGELAPDPTAPDHDHVHTENPCTIAVS